MKRKKWEVKHKCDNCGKGDAWVERIINGKRLRFCSRECAKKFERRLMVE